MSAAAAAGAADSKSKSNGPKPFRILCYGDSLTEGWYQFGTKHSPYADTLQTRLNELHAGKTKSKTPLPSTEAVKKWLKGISRFEVDNNGLAGDQVITMTRRLTNQLKDETINGARSGSYDLVAILAGTNDLFNRDTSADKMHNAAVSLHRLVHAHAPNARSIAMTVPEFDADESNQKEEDKRVAFNSKLTEFTKANPDRVIPFDLSKLLPYNSLSAADKKLYWDDGVHFTAAGYARIGELIFDTICQSAQLLSAAPPPLPTTATATATATTAATAAAK